MKIWIQCFNYYPNVLGGSERSARELANGLAARGHEITIVLSDGTVSYPSEVDGLPIKVIEGLRIGKSPHSKTRSFTDRALWVLRSEIDMLLYHRILRELKNDKPDIVIMNNPAGHGLAMLRACRKLGVHVLPIIRDYGWICAFGTMMRSGKPCDKFCNSCRCYSLARRSQLKQLPMVVAISNYIANLCAELINAPAVRVIYNSIPDIYFSEITARSGNQTKLHFGYLGRLHESKGVGQLIDGWKRSGIFNEGHRLTLAGTNQGIEISKDVGLMNIKYVGEQDAITFLDTLDVLFTPSVWPEPFGRSVIEGISRGAYVVGSGTGAFPELIHPPFGETLTSVNPDSIAQTLQRIAQQPEAIFNTRMVDRTSATSRFRSNLMLDNYVTLIDELVNA